MTSKDEEKFRGTCRVQVIRSSSEWSLGIKREVGQKSIDKMKEIVILLILFLFFYFYSHSTLSTMLIWNVLHEPSTLSTLKINFLVSEKRGGGAG